EAVDASQRLAEPALTTGVEIRLEHRSDDGMLHLGLGRRPVQLPVESGWVVAQPRVELGGGVDVLLDLPFDALHVLLRRIQDRVLDGAELREQERHQDSFRTSRDHAWMNREVTGAEERVRLALTPVLFEPLQGLDHLHALLDRVDADLRASAPRPNE